MTDRILVRSQNFKNYENEKLIDEMRWNEMKYIFSSDNFKYVTCVNDGVDSTSMYAKISV